ALAAAIAAHRAGMKESGTEPGSSPTRPAGAARIRMALHTGEVAPETVLSGSPVLLHATRLLQATHPGQILLSEKCAALLKDGLEPGLELVDLGGYRLHDSAPAERLFQLCPTGISPREFPPPKALSAQQVHL